MNKSYILGGFVVAAAFYFYPKITTGLAGITLAVATVALGILAWFIGTEVAKIQL